MKKSIFTVLVMFVVLTLKAQSTDDIYFDAQDQRSSREFVYTGAGNTDAFKNEAAIANIQYCLQRYKAQQYLATGTAALGGIAIIASGGDEDLINKVSAGMGLLSLIIYVDSFKWLERTSVTPTKNGATFRFKF